MTNTSFRAARAAGGRHLSSASLSRQASILALAASLAFSGTAAAQSTADSETPLVADVIVVEGTRGALNRALTVKREDLNFIDAIVAEDIAQFPDNNIAEALQRVPGVTINRDNGEGRTIVVRGFTPNFTRVEINGLTAVTTQNSRNFDFAVLASELFSSAEVRKSASANYAEGGLAATVNLTTPKPLDFDDVVFVASADGAYAEQADELNSRASLVVAKNWNDVFGVAASFAYSDQSLFREDYTVGSWDFARDSIANSAEPGLPEELLDARFPRNPRRQLLDQNRERLGGTLDIQFRPSDAVELTLSGIYSDSTRSGPELRFDFLELEGGLTNPRDFVIDNGRVVAGVFDSAQPRVYSQFLDLNDTFAQAAFDGRFNLTETLRATAKVGYSRAEAETLSDFWSFGVFGTGSFQLEGDYVIPSFIPDNDNDGVPDNDGSAIDFSDPANFVNWRFFSGARVLQVNDEWSFEGAVEKDFAQTPFLSAVSVGVRYADRAADRERGEFVARPSDPGSAAPAGGLGADPSIQTLVPWNLSGAPAAYPDDIFRINNEAALSVFGVPDFVRPVNPLQSFRISEESIAGFVKADFELDRLRGDAGVRVVSTDTTSSGARSLRGIAAIVGGQTIDDIEDVTFDNSYTEVLPSTNWRYAARDDLIIRAAAGKTLTRPGLADLSPESTIDIGRGTGRSGNPELEPFTAWNYDVSVEWYFAPEALFGVSVFHKDIGALVETLTEDVILDLPGTQGEPPSPTTISLRRPINGDSASVTGVEVIAQTPFSFLPGPFGNLGGAFNYAFADSSATFSNEDDVRSITLPGLSKHSFNAVLYYQDGRIDTRLAYNWRDDYLAQTFGSGGQPIYRDAFGQLDFSVNYRLLDSLELRFEALNLTDEGVFEYTDQREDLPTSFADNERIFKFGLRFEY